ncbi:hypothetical protein Scep_010530 [Stephania cephalantha]|uniref:Uncharacterized protein n=1 Tax=Stephania cephalantha TaxID=152367 RepID=A0AAP0JVY8_9MAGN
MFSTHLCMSFTPFLSVHSSNFISPSPTKSINSSIASSFSSSELFKQLPPRDSYSYLILLTSPSKTANGIPTKIPIKPTNAMTTPFQHDIKHIKQPNLNIGLVPRINSASRTPSCSISNLCNR